MAGETILILGGTGEARRLADRLVHDGRYRVISSLAGRTSDPDLPPGEVRMGGFGGAEGLKRFLAEERIALLADATHPFAAQMSRHGAEACESLAVPCLRLERPEWREGPGDDWTVVADAEAAAAALPAGKTALVTVGRQELAPFLARADVSLVARMIEAPEAPVPDHCEVMLARPPYTMEYERVTFRQKGVDVLVTKNSGGAATQAKLLIARELSVPVVMIARPAKPEGPVAHDVETMAAMIEAKLS